MTYASTFVYNSVVEYISLCKCFYFSSPLMCTDLHLYKINTLSLDQKMNVEQEPYFLNIEQNSIHLSFLFLNKR